MKQFYTTVLMLPLFLAIMWGLTYKSDTLLALSCLMLVLTIPKFYLTTICKSSYSESVVALSMLGQKGTLSAFYIFGNPENSKTFGGALIFCSFLSAFCFKHTYLSQLGSAGINPNLFIALTYFLFCPYHFGIFDFSYTNGIAILLLSLTVTLLIGYYQKGNTIEHAVSQGKASFQQIQSFKALIQEGGAIVNGAILRHLDACNDTQCTCVNIIEKIDQMQIVRSSRPEIVEKLRELREEAEEFMPEKVLMTKTNKRLLNKCISQREADVYSADSPIKHSRPRDSRVFSEKKKKQVENFNQCFALQANHQFETTSFFTNSEQALPLDMQISHQQELLLQLYDLYEERPNISQDEYQQFTNEYLLIKCRKALKEESNNLELHLFQASLFIDTPLRALFMIFKRKFPLNVSLRQRYLEFYLLQRIDVALIKRDPICNLKGNDFNELFHYERVKQSFYLSEFKLASKVQQFWSTFEQGLLSQAVQIGRTMANEQQQLLRIYEKLHSLRQHDPEICYKWALLQYNILNESSQARDSYLKILTLSATETHYKEKFSSQSIYCNEETSIIVLDIIPNEVTKIFYANNQTTYALGSNSKELVGQKVNKLVPGSLSHLHDEIVQGFLNSSIVNQACEPFNFFLINKQGYLALCEIQAQVLPNLTKNQLQVVCTTQPQMDQSSSFLPLDQQYDHFDKFFILTDSYHRIECVSAGCFREYGLSAECIKSMGEGELKIEDLMPEIGLVDDVGQIEEGVEVQMSTEDIMVRINEEKLDKESYREISIRVGKFRVLIQRASFQFFPHAKPVYLYRLVTMPTFDQGVSRGQTPLMIRDMDFARTPKRKPDTNLSNESQMNMFGGGSGVSVSSGHSSASTSSSTDSFNKAIQHFKQSLYLNKTPKMLVTLNRIIWAVILLSMLFSILEYSFKLSISKSIIHEGQHSIQIKNRTVSYVQSGYNSRTLINLANTLEQSIYQGELARMNRSSYLFELINNQVEKLKETHDFCTQQRIEESGERDEQADFEEQMIQVYRVGRDGETYAEKMSFKVALRQYVNQMQHLLSLSLTEIDHLKTLGAIQGFLQTRINITLVTNWIDLDAMAFILLNRLRDMREFVYTSSDYQTDIAYSQTFDELFFGLMLAGIMITVISIILLMFQLAKLGVINRDILRVFTSLNRSITSDNLFKINSYLIILAENQGLESPQQIQPQAINPLSTPRIFKEFQLKSTRLIQVSELHQESDITTVRQQVCLLSKSQLDKINMVQTNQQEISVENESSLQNTQILPVNFDCRQLFKYSLGILLIAAIFGAYYVQCYFIHVASMASLIDLKLISPLYINRYTDITLSLAFLRERIILNSSLDDYAHSAFHTYTNDHLDDFFHLRSMDNERQLQQVKKTKGSSGILKAIITYSSQIDTTELCQSISQEGYSISKDFDIPTYDKYVRSQPPLTLQSYHQMAIDGHALLEAACIGDLEMIRISTLQLEQVINYDNRTLLHQAALYNQTQIVRYLVEDAKQDTSFYGLRDYWMMTALDLATDVDIQGLLRKVIKGERVQSYNLQRKPYVKLGARQALSLFAARYNDLIMIHSIIEGLITINGEKGIGTTLIDLVDSEGRSLLHIAAAAGQTEIVKYLVTRGANITLLNLFGMDPLSEALYFGQVQTAEYLQGLLSKKSVIESCQTICQGLLAQGMSQAFGVFHKRFQDLSLLIPKQRYEDNLKILSSANSTLTQFSVIQELYLSLITTKLLSLINQAQVSFMAQYLFITKWVFQVFIILQIIILLFLRGSLIRKMRADLISSLGMITLIPEAALTEAHQSHPPQMAQVSPKKKKFASPIKRSSYKQDLEDSPSKESLSPQKHPLPSGVFVQESPQSHLQPSVRDQILRIIELVKQ
ncbi:hypothetical protein FGO68_gene4076 [Halteria grandinella]|uniref:PAS domain-containing protein n=1 Tax=Halteria grandinella TaxID=5974 RepID=A0A8J8P7Z7_HALGN|nr:hypothetical protein FGO68_gene4076 [Halteria grandinella]